MAIAGGSLKANITTLGPLVLPYSEQLLFFFNLIANLATKAVGPARMAVTLECWRVCIKAVHLSHSARTDCSSIWTCAHYRLTSLLPTYALSAKVLWQRKLKCHTSDIKLAIATITYLQTSSMLQTLNL